MTFRELLYHQVLFTNNKKAAVKLRENGVKMKMLWCWRCRQGMPMLDEPEYAEAVRLYGECMKATKEFRQQWDVPLASAGTHERFRPVREWYEQLTGVADCHQSEIMHHRLSALGGPCRVCGRPLRSPRAKRCAACGAAA